MSFPKRYLVSLASASFVALAACGGHLRIEQSTAPAPQKSPSPTQQGPNLASNPTVTPKPVEQAPAPRAATPTSTPAPQEALPELETAPDFITRPDGFAFVK